MLSKTLSSVLSSTTMKPSPTITIRSAQGGRVVQLEGTRYVFGRLRSSDLAFPEDGSLSKQHMVLEREGDEWAVVDLESRNGTFVNGTRLEGRRHLAPGDTIRAGQLRITFGPTTEETVVFSNPDPHGLPPGSVRTNLERALEEQQAHAAPAGAAATSPLAIVVRAGRELAARRSAPELFSTILDLAVDAAGARRGVLLTGEGLQLVVRATRGDGFRISTTVRDSVLRDKASLLVPDTLLDPAYRERDSIVAQRVRTFMAVPLQTDEQVIGLLYLDGPVPSRRWTPDDLNLLTVLANIAALSLERERLQRAEEAQRSMALELAQAAQMQRRFLPAEAPEVPGVELAGYNAPSRSVGGDYYDFLALPDGSHGCVLADVAGKGLAAALVMTNLQARVQVLSQTQPEPAAFMTTLHRVVQASCPEDRFITVFYCVLDAATGRVQYANAGHNPPILVRADGAVEWLKEGGPILGILTGIEYDAFEATLATGDALVLYSDGLTDAASPDGEPFGESRLAAAVTAHRHRGARELLEAIQARVTEWSNGTPLVDDLTVVVVKKT